MSIEGIPEGWELVRVGRVNRGEFFLNDSSIPEEWDFSLESNCGNYIIIRKIEKKQYRPFANAAEFLAHPLSGDWIDLGADEFAKVIHCNDSGIRFSDDDDIQHYEDAFVDLCFRDGTPFGVEVTE